MVPVSFICVYKTSHATVVVDWFSYIVCVYIVFFVSCVIASVVSWDICFIICFCHPWLVLRVFKVNFIVWWWVPERVLYGWNFQWLMVIVKVFTFVGPGCLRRGFQTFSTSVR